MHNRRASLGHLLLPSFLYAALCPPCFIRPHGIWCHLALAMASPKDQFTHSNTSFCPKYLESPPSFTYQARETSISSVRSMEGLLNSSNLLHVLPHANVYMVVRSNSD
uniref:Secreted protein n=1 Tax=Opuntia streptacantha TaxID=393608 RepID=A0A7C8YGS4_OPUST